MDVGRVVVIVLVVGVLVAVVTVTECLAQPVGRGVRDQDRPVLAHDAQVRAVRRVEDRRREDRQSGSPSRHDAPVDAHDPRQVSRHGVELVGGHHDRHAGAVEVREQMQHLVAGLDVDAAGGLIEQQQHRVADHGPGQEHALLLTAGELPHLAVAQAADAQSIEHPVRRPRDPGASSTSATANGSSGP